MKMIILLIKCMLLQYAYQLAKLEAKKKNLNQKIIEIQVLLNNGYIPILHIPEFEEEHYIYDSHTKSHKCNCKTLIKESLQTYQTKLSKAIKDVEDIRLLQDRLKGIINEVDAKQQEKNKIFAQHFNLISKFIWWKNTISDSKMMTKYMNYLEILGINESCNVDDTTMVQYAIIDNDSNHARFIKKCIFLLTNLIVNIKTEFTVKSDITTPTIKEITELSDNLKIMVTIP